MRMNGILVKRKVLMARQDEIVEDSSFNVVADVPGGPCAGADGGPGPQGWRPRVEYDIAQAQAAGDIDAEVVARLQQFEHLLRHANRRGGGGMPGAYHPDDAGFGPGCGPQGRPQPGDGRAFRGEPPVRHGGPWHPQGPGMQRMPYAGENGLPGFGPGCPPFAGAPGGAAPLPAPGVQAGPWAGRPEVQGHPGFEPEGAMPGEPGRNHGESRERGKGRVLVTLALQDGMSQRDLAYILGIRPQSLGETLGKLEREGFITRERSDTDKRTIVVKLTDAGRDQAQRVKARRNTTVESLLSKLTTEEKQQLCRLLKKMTEE